MSEENVEIVRAAVAAWNRRDFDAAVKDGAPDVEFDATRELGEWRGVYTTPTQVKRMWQRFTEPWESFHVEIDAVIEAGEQLVSRQTVTMKGRDGIEVTVRSNYVWSFRNGAVTRVVSYREFEDATEAAGLSE